MSNESVSTQESNESVIVRIAKKPSRLLRRLYDWTISWSKTKRAPQALFGIAFAESSFFPVPPDVLLIPMVVARQKRWFAFALTCTAGSVSGALLGYLIGWVLWESVGQPIVAFYDLESAMALVQTKYSENAFLAVLVAAFTPIPYKVFTISAGLCKIPVVVLVSASVLGRAGRFFLVAALLRLYGEKISKSIEKYFDLFSLIFLGLLVGGFLVIKYLH